MVAEFTSTYFDYHDITPERRQAVTFLLHKMEEFMEPRTIQDMSSLDLERFLLSRGCAHTTTLKHVKMLRAFFRWCWQRGFLPADQYLRLREVKAPQGAAFGEPKPYTRGEIGEFWEYLEDAFPFVRTTDQRDNTPAKAEFYVRRFQRGASQWLKVQPYARRLQVEAIVSLALFGGLRRIEIFNLALEDMHYDNAYIRVTGARKNAAREAKVRMVPMTDPMRLALGNWLEFRAQVLQPPHESPWLTLWREDYLVPLKFRNLAHILDRVGDGYELHRLRHTYATERLRAGMKVEKLQVALGHSNIGQTLRYARITSEDVLREAEQTNDQFMAAVDRQHVVI